MTAIKLPELPRWLQDDAYAMFVICGLHPEELRKDFRAYAKRAVRMNAEVTDATARRQASEIIFGMVALLKGIAVLGLECNHNGRPALDIIGDLIAAQTPADFIAALTHQEAHHGN